MTALVTPQQKEVWLTKTFTQVITTVEDGGFKSALLPGYRIDDGSGMKIISATGASKDESVSALFEKVVHIGPQSYLVSCGRGGYEFTIDPQTLTRKSLTPVLSCEVA